MQKQMVQQQIHQWRTHVAFSPHPLTQIHQWSTCVALNPHIPIQEASKSWS